MTKFRETPPTVRAGRPREFGIPADGTARLGTTTVAFTDLVGSTAYLSEHGEEAADAARRLHMATVADLAAAHQGEVVKNTGDGAMLVFGSAVEAVDAMVEVQRLAFEGGGPGVRVGIGVGDAITEAGDYFGTPVVVAARLCDRAASGQILASALVADLAGGRTKHRFEPVGRLPLKGLADPVATCEVRPEGSEGFEGVGVVVTAEDAGRGLDVPLPTPIRAVEGVFVGRTAEMATLEGHLATAVGGVPHLVLIGGEQGAGKSRLAAEFARRAHDDGATVLFGRCDGGRPYAPFVQMIDHLAGTLTDETLTGYLRGRGGELLRIAPHLADRHQGGVVPGEGSGDRFQLFEAVRSLVWGVAAANPVVLAFDNLHLADDASIALLRHLIASSAPGRVVMTATVVSEPGARDLVPIWDLERVETVSSMHLHGLTADDVGVLADSWAGTPINRGTAEALHRHTVGNPMFVREVLRTLLEEGWSVDSEIPIVEALEQTRLSDTVRGVLGRRLDRLSETAMTVLPAAAVVGQEFEARLVQRVLDLPMDIVLGALEEGVGVGAITELPASGGGFRFEHDLARRALHDRLGLRDRALLHHRVAELLEAARAAGEAVSPATLARHYVAAAAVADPTQIAEHCESAGNAALRELAWEDAARQYRSALDAFSGPDTTDAVRLLRKEGAAMWAAGRVEEARLTLARGADLAEAAGLTTELARIALSFSGEGIGAQVVEIGVVDEQARDMVHRALEAIGKDDSPERARLLAAKTFGGVYSSRLEERVELAQEATAMARRLGDPEVLAEVLLRSSIAQFGIDDLDDRLRELDEVLALRSGQAQDVVYELAMCVKLVILYTIGNVEESERLFNANEDRFTSSRDPFLRLWVRWSGVHKAALQGRFEEADREIQGTFEQAVGRPGDTSYAHPSFGVVTIYAGQTGMTRFFQGRLGELAPIFTSFGEAVPGFELWRAAATVAWLNAARPDLAREAFASLDIEGVDSNFLTLTTLAVAGEAAYLLDDRVAADQLWEILAPRRDWCDTAYMAVGFGSMARIVGHLAVVRGDLDLAIELYEQAQVTDRRLGAVSQALYDDVSLASALYRRDGSTNSRADELIATATKQAGELGIGQVVAAARRVETEVLGMSDTQDPTDSGLVQRAWSASVVAAKSTTARRFQSLMRRVTVDDDATIERRLGTEQRLKALMLTVAAGFRRDRAFGFEGDVGFSLNYATPGMQRVEPIEWTVEIDGRRARARTGRSTHPTVVVHLTVADFARFVAGELGTVSSLLEGRVGVEGDLEVAGRLVDMFGQFDLD